MGRSRSSFGTSSRNTSGRSSSGFGSSSRSGSSRGTGFGVGVGMGVGMSVGMGMGRGHGRHHNHPAMMAGIPIFKSNDLLKAITPNVQNTYKRKKGLNTLFLLLGIGSIALFIFSMILMFTTGEWKTNQGWESHVQHFGHNVGNSSREPNTAYVPLVIAGVVGAIVFLTLAISRMTANRRRKALVKIIEKVTLNNKVGMEDLAFCMCNMRPLVNNEEALARIVERLIETKNIEGYEVIGLVGVAKTSLRARESDFVVAQHVNVVGGNTTTQEQQRATHCAGCGSAITKESGKFCGFCGTKL